MKMKKNLIFIIILIININLLTSILSNNNNNNKNNKNNNNIDEKYDNYINFLYYSSFIAKSGYGMEAITFATELSKIKLMAENENNNNNNNNNEKINLFNFGIVQHGEQLDSNVFNKFNKNKQLLLNDLLLVGDKMKKKLMKLNTNNEDDYNSLNIIFCHSPPPAWLPSEYPSWDSISPCPITFKKSNYINIGRTMYETNNVPKKWVEKLNKMDALLVPSQFHINSFIKNGVKKNKLHILPIPIDSKFFNKKNCKNNYNNKKTIRFLSIFKMEKRKGYDILINSFINEFKNDKNIDNIELIIKTQKFKDEINIDKLYKNKKNIPKITIITDHLDDQELIELYCNNIDAFVLPTYGEGWGLPIVEAMSLELPVITTNFSAPSEYITHNKDGLLLDYDLVDTGYEKNHQWAKVKEESLKKMLRYIYNDKLNNNSENIKLIGKNARLNMIKNYNPEKIIDKLMGLVEEIILNLNIKTNENIKDEL